MPSAYHLQECQSELPYTHTMTRMLTVLFDILMLPLVLVKYTLQYCLGLHLHWISAPGHCFPPQPREDVKPAANTDAQEFAVLIVAVDLQKHVS